MKISLVSYQRIVKEVDIEFPFYYKSVYDFEGYKEETYAMVLKDGTRFMITDDSDGCTTFMRSKIDLSTELPDELFGRECDIITQYTPIFEEDFMERYNKFVEEGM